MVQYRQLTRTTIPFVVTLGGTCITATLEGAVLLLKGCQVRVLLLAVLACAGHA